MGWSGVSFISGRSGFGDPPGTAVEQMPNAWYPDSCVATRHQAHHFENWFWHAFDSPHRSVSCDKAIAGK